MLEVVVSGGGGSIHGARRVTERQLARSLLLAQLSSLDGTAELQTTSAAFDMWQAEVEGLRGSGHAEVEDVCDLFEVSLAGVAVECAPVV
jgi:hypothetical protein